MAKTSQIRKQRASQLEEARKVLDILRRELKALNESKAVRDNLASHSDGFYVEVATLAKSRSLLEATDLVVEQLNDIIRDTKKIVIGDIHLSRIKEFVPAGKNPVYPDVLLVARAVRQCLDRCKRDFERQNIRINAATSKARTVVGALECFLDDEENTGVVLQDDVERYVEGELTASCFTDSEEYDDYFDFETLDSQTVENYIRGIEDEKGDRETETGPSGAKEVEEQDETVE